MQWNHVPYDIQLKVMDKIGDLMLKEENETLMFAMASALVELELWSNSPIPGDEPYAAQAGDPFCEQGWD